MSTLPPQPESGDLLADLEALQDQVLHGLDALNEQVLAVLKEWTPARSEEEEEAQRAAA